LRKPTTQSRQVCMWNSFSFGSMEHILTLMAIFVIGFIHRICPFLQKSSTWSYWTWIHCTTIHCSKQWADV
jgi:hypothetical protein